MKITKFAKLVKKSGRCEVINIYEEGVWLSNGQALYKATQLPLLDDFGQVYAVLDIPPNKKKSPIVNITDKTEKKFGLVDFQEEPEDGSEVKAEELKIQAAYQGLVCNVLWSEDKELLFYSADLLAPIYERIAEGYVRYYVRGKGNDKYIVIKDGFELIACIMPLKFLHKEYISDLQDYLNACVDQFGREEEREKAKEREDGEQMSVETQQQEAEE